MTFENDLEVVVLPTSELVPYANNAKKHTRGQVDTICESIKQFGFNDPIAVWHNSNGEPEIVEGHGRVLAAQKLGIKELPTIALDRLSDEQRRAYTHVHNQTTMNSGVNKDILFFDLSQLSKQFNFADFGFDNFAEKKEENLVNLELMELNEFEHHDYIVFLFDTVHDFVRACDEFAIKKRR